MGRSNGRIRKAPLPASGACTRMAVSRRRTARRALSPIEHQPTADATSTALPISLLSGRLRDHWHGMSRTGTVPRLFNLEDEPLLAMHPCDMRHRGLESGDLVKVSNGRGEVAVRIAERAGLKKGRAWMPMHWGSQFMNSPGANALACDATDPYSRQPELKHAAVQIEKLDLPYPLAVVRSCDSQPEALEMMQRARALLAAFPYATLGLYGRKRPLVVFRAAAATATDATAIAALDRLFGMAGDDGAIVYADAAPESQQEGDRPGWPFARCSPGRRNPGPGLAQTGDGRRRTRRRHDSLCPGAKRQAAGKHRAAQHHLQMRRCQRCPDPAGTGRRRRIAATAGAR